MDEVFAELLTQLRSARVARGWDLAQVAQKLHITSTQVAALEEGRFQELPGAAFARGYLRNYARLLDLDVEGVLAAYDRYHGSSGLRPSEEVLPRSELPLLDYSRKMLFFSILLAIALIILGWWLWGRGSSAVSAPAAVAASASASNRSAAQVVMSTPVETAALTSPAFSVTTTTAAAASPSPITAMTLSAMSGALVFHFTGDCWVQVRDASGNIVLSTLGKAGQDVTVTQGQPPYRILIGKASAVQITYAGKPVALPANALNVARVQVGAAPVAAPTTSVKLAQHPLTAAQSVKSLRPSATTASSRVSAVASDESTFSEVAHATSVTHSAP